MKSISLRASLAGFVALLLASSAVHTSAHAVTYYLTEGEVVLGGNLAPPGYGTVEVTTVGGNLKFDLQMAPNWFVDTGSHHAVTFRLATSGLTISGLPTPFVQVSGSSFGNSPFSHPANLFNYAIDCDSPGQGSDSCNQVPSLVFYVLGAGSLSLVQTDGVYITADIRSAITRETGVVGAPDAGIVIEEVPGPIAGAGLPGLVLAFGGFFAWWRRRKTVPVAA